jgi:hypothetical protein
MVVRRHAGILVARIPGCNLAIKRAADRKSLRDRDVRHLGTPPRSDMLVSRRHDMRHHVIFWRMAKREADVDDAELDALLHQEERGEGYVEFLDGRRRALTWDDDRHRWVAERSEAYAA